MRRVFLFLVLIGMFVLPSLAPTAQGTQTYVVQPGDNLFRISLRFGVPLATMQQVNGIVNPNLIYVGQVLQIPAGGNPQPSVTPGGPRPTPGSQSTYTVKPGDTLSAIAARFGTTISAIAQANNIVNINLIFVGQVLVIPAGGVVPPVPTTVPPGPTAAPPGPVSGFGLGGQILGLSGNTQAAMHSAKMTWAKIQIAAGDGAGASFIAQAKTAGFKTLVSVVGDRNSVLDAGYQSNYAAFVGNLAADGANAIEVWNEENLDREWPTGQISPSSYVGLLSKAYTAIKAKNAGTLVIMGAPSPTGAAGAGGVTPNYWNDDVYYQGLAAAGAGSYADCVGVHYNEGIVSPNQTSGDPRDNYPTRYFSTMLNRALISFPGKSACFTELGYLSHPAGYPPLPAGFAWAANTTDNQQAQWLGEAVTRARGSGRVGLLIVFNVDFTGYGADPQAGYAIIRPGNMCIACGTLAAAAP